jgi:transcription-repair coupling factor (superfamily II helicase)
VPEVRPVIVHGDLPPTETDEAMVAFARGEGDILIATSLIESGLDVPRANTMLITRADRFGLAQLHQLRGRVGRGRARGFALLFTDPEHPPSAATLKRLETLSTLDRLGAGFEISARDLDQRGAGDLFGEEQAGHLKLIGVGLHRRLLRRALAEARGGAPVPELPALSLGDEGAIPAALVPEAALRLGLYVRLARLESVAEVGAFAAEFEDRFGRQPPAVRRLIAAASLRLAARDTGLAEVEAGPQAVALTFHDRSRAQAALAALIARSEGKLDWRSERLVFERPTKTPAERRRVLAKLIAAVTRATARSAPGRARREARAGAPPLPRGGPPDRGRS